MTSKGTRYFFAVLIQSLSKPIMVITQHLWALIYALVIVWHWSCKNELLKNSNLGKMLLILSLHIFYTLLFVHTHREKTIYWLTGKEKNHLTAVNVTGLVFPSWLLCQVTPLYLSQCQCSFFMRLKANFLHLFYALSSSAWTKRNRGADKDKTLLRNSEDLLPHIHVTI